MGTVVMENRNALAVAEWSPRPVSVPGAVRGATQIGALLLTGMPACRFPRTRFCNGQAAKRSADVLRETEAAASFCQLAHLQRFLPSVPGDVRGANADRRASAHRHAGLPLSEDALL
jgi:hypothetical protein